MKRDFATKEEAIISELSGDLIRFIYKKAEHLACLHAAISSPRGDYFRRQLLQHLGSEKKWDDLDKFKSKCGVVEYERHMHKLMEHGLVECRDNKKKGVRTYIRTDKGETAVNALRALERDITATGAEKIFNAHLGQNSFRLFLRVYGGKRKPTIIKDSSGKKHLEIQFKPVEAGYLTAFLPRSTDGIAAIDKLDDAGLLIFGDDGKIHFPARTARAFYQYLRSLYQLL